MSTYYYKLISNLTTANFYLPRWQLWGQDETLFDPIPLPTLQSVNNSFPSYSLTSFSSGTPNNSLLLNTFLEAFINEKQQLQPVINSMSLDGLGY